MLSLDQVTKRVGRAVHIHETSLTLEPGSLNVLLGPTLAGKTTLMRLMAGLEPPTSGRVLVDGRDVTGLPVRDRDVAMVYQQFINYPGLTVYENIASPLRVRKAPEAEVDRAVRQAAELLRLEPLLQRRPLELSGGQQQRTAIARAIVKRAKLVLLDEPLANLDYKLREELRAELPSIFAETGAVFVYATTEPEEALLLGGQVATLHEGRITQFGPTAEVYRSPVDLVTARTFSDPPLNTLRVEKRQGRMVSAGGLDLPAGPAFADLPDGPYVLGLRPDHVALAARGPGDAPVEGRVAVTEITGSESFVHIDVEDERWTALLHGVHHLTVGAAETFWVAPERFFIFDEAGSLVVSPALAKAA